MSTVFLALQTNEDTRPIIEAIMQDNPHAAYAKTMPVLDPAEDAAENHPPQASSPEDLSPNANAPTAEPPARIRRRPEPPAAAKESWIACPIVS